MREGELIGGRYVLGGLLGSGGMGRVYRARDERLRREVALKVMEERHAETPEFVGRFEREAANAASLSHPNVVRVFDSGEDESGRPYIAMELVGGGTLKDRIRNEGPLPPREAAAVAVQVAEALEAAHEAGIVHRDVKPENVLLTEDGQAKVGDFGIAKATEATAVTHTSMMLGTAPYLSPEQAKGEPVGPASDLYSLGVVLFEALTGRPPFGTGEHVSPLAVAMKHLNEPAPAARATDPAIPEPLERITLALMRKDPAERHPSAGVLANDLTAFLEGRPLPSRAAALVAASPEFAETGVLRRAPANTTRRPRRKRRAAVPVLAVTLAALLALAASPLAPPDDPFRLVSAESTTVNRSVPLEARQAPDAPEPPPEQTAKAPEQPAETPEPPPPKPEEREPLPQEPEEPEPTPTLTPTEEPAPPETDPATSSASASADASASASAGTASSAPSGASATAAAGQDAPEPPSQETQASPSPSSAGSSAAPAEDSSPAAPAPAPPADSSATPAPAPAPPADSSATPAPAPPAGSSAAPAPAPPADSSAGAGSSAAPAPGGQPAGPGAGEDDGPVGEVPEVEVPDF